MSEKEDLLTVAETAKILRTHSSTVRKWIKEGTLRAIKLPHPGKRTTYRVARSTIDELIQGKSIDERTTS
jgi:excisionase family DNA binding protein